MGFDDAVLTVATVNVNGIRAAFRRGMGEWVAVRKPDVLLLQEVRAPQELVGDHLPADGWDLAHAESTTKGRSGVAIASRLPMSAIRIGLGPDLPSDSGRWVEADLELPGGPSLTVVSTYVHSGTLGTPSMEEKYAFLDLVTRRLGELRAAGRIALLAGDVNIASGWVDLGRRLGGEGPGPYTWWSWRGKAFDNDAGWRIDYQLASPELAPHAVKAEVDRAPSYAERFSDHAPFVVTYDL